MSRRAAVVEEFDDDTDLPLPNKPLPNTGARGALLEHIDGSDSDDDGDDDDDAPTLLNNAAGPASPSFPQFRPGAGPGTDGSNNVTDITPYKKCVLSRPVLYIPPPCPPPRGLRE